MHGRPQGLGRLASRSRERAGRLLAGDRKPRGEPRPPTPFSELPAEDRVFFLVGVGKSGTSWLMQLLDAHPQVLCSGEGRFFGRDSRAVGGTSLSGAMLDSPLLREWAGASSWTRRSDPDATLISLTGTLVRQVMADELASHPGARVVGDKTPLTSASTVAEIAAACPGARVIHVIRDGRDVAVSSVHHVWNHTTAPDGRRLISDEQAAIRDAYRADPGRYGADGESIFAMGHVALLAEKWAEQATAAREQGRRLLGDDYLEVRYEDLLADGVGSARGLFRFLGVADEEEAARRCVERTSFERSAGRTRGEEDSESFLRKGVAGDWREVMTEPNRESFREIAGGALVELGYERDLRW